MANPTAPAPQAPAPTTAPAKGTPTAQPAAAAPTPAEIKRMKLKLDGQEVEMSEPEVIQLAQRGKTSDKRFQEAAALRKQAEDVIKFAKENPTEFFNKTGRNAREWAEEYLTDILEQERMSPAQKDAAADRKRVREYEKKEKDEADRKKLQDEETLTKSHRDRLEKVFIESLSKCGLPKTEFTVMRMAALTRVKNKLGLDLDADQLATLVREDYIKEQKHLFGAPEITGDQIIDMIGPDILKKISKAQLAKLKAKTQTPSTQASTVKAKNTAPVLSWREYQLRNRGRLPK